jgi:hypothetical protein
MHPGQRSAAASSVPSACLDHASRDVASVLEESGQEVGRGLGEGGRGGPGRRTWRWRGGGEGSALAASGREGGVTTVIERGRDLLVRRSGCERVRERVRVKTLIVLLYISPRCVGILGFCWSGYSSELGQILGGGPYKITASVNDLPWCLYYNARLG